MTFQSKEELTTILVETFEDKWYARENPLSGPFLGLMDTGFMLPEIDVLRDLVDYDPIIPAARPFSREQAFDCEEYAQHFKAKCAIYNLYHTDSNFPLAIGIVWGEFTWVDGFHAANCVVLDDLTVMLIEPQMPELFAIDQCLKTELVIF